jgi:hypothetical protein
MGTFNRTALDKGWHAGRMRFDAEEGSRPRELRRPTPSIDADAVGLQMCVDALTRSSTTDFTDRFVELFGEVCSIAAAMRGVFQEASSLQQPDVDRLLAHHLSVLRCWNCPAPSPEPPPGRLPSTDITD